ncbi:MAG: hypothetical protein WA049_00120 [Ferribacterium limneticum]
MFDVAVADPFAAGATIVAIVDFAALGAFGPDAIDQMQHVLMIPADSVDRFFTIRWHDFVSFQENIAARSCGQIVQTLARIFESGTGLRLFLWQTVPVCASNVGELAVGWFRKVG